jgi:LmbE family N-acetylglucosaminyl deacetylase
MNKVLVISPHPDDEAIGCGGAIIKHTEEGDTVHVIFLTSGEKGGHGRSKEETRKIREDEAKEAAIILKTSKTEFWREPDGMFVVTKKNIEQLTNKLIEFKCDIIYAPHPNEAHPDHIAAALLVKKVLNGLNDEIKKPSVLMFEVWTPIQKMDHILDITSFIERKRKAILSYKSQCEVISFDDAILGLNRYRGEMHCWPSGEYAEVFLNL